MRRLLALVIAFTPILLHAQTIEIPALQVPKPPTIDGTVNDDEWAGIPSIEGMVDANTGSPAPDAAKFWIAYDKDFVYFAAKMADTQPSQIKANEYRTNVELGGDDTLSLFLDLSGTAADFNIFRVNPKGATYIRLAGGRAAKREWTGDFYSRGRISEAGWETEGRIPWQVLRLPGAGKRNLRVNFTRFVQRTQRGYIHVFTPAQNAKDTPTWTQVDLPSQTFVRTLKLLPYAYAGFDIDRGHVLNGGLDLKTQITDQIELVGSINPDFRNIQNQILSLDFSRFERLAGETRPFFQEGSQYIGSALFASQRIDNFDLGVNAYGKISNKTSFGFLNTVDWDRKNFVGSELTKGTRNNFVGTVTHDADPTLQMRLSVSSMNRPDRQNDAYLVRLTKTIGDFSVQARDLASKDSLGGYGRFTDAYLYYQRNGWSGSAGYGQATPEFNPALGFFPDRDYKGWNYDLQYTKNFDKGFLNDWGFYVAGNTFDHMDGAPYRHEFTINPYTTLRNGLAIVPFASWSGFESSNDHLYGLDIGYPRGNQYRSAAVSYYWGKQAGFDYKSIAASVAYRTLGKLQTSLRVQHVELDQKMDQLIFSANYDLGKDRSLSGRLVREANDTNFYIALRQSGNLGTEYFLILGDPNSRTFRSSLILKVTVPFELAPSKHKPGVKETISAL